MKKRKRIQTSAAAVVLAAAMVFAIPASAEPAQASTGTTSCTAVASSQAVVSASGSSMELSKKSLVLTKGTSKKLKVKNSGGKTVTWKSKNTSVATVSSNGKVKGVKTGKTTITAKVGKKTFKCKVYVKAGYGSATGNVTYHYNSYVGYMADTNARVFFIPTDGSAKTGTLSKNDFYTNDINKLAKNYIYSADVDGTGNYTISNIPAGNYIVLIISNKQSASGWFNASSKATYYKNISKSFKAYLRNSTALNLAKSISYYQYSITTGVKVTKNQTVTISHAFPYTYI